MSVATVHQFPAKQERRAPRVNAWRWNEHEDAALESLPPEIERLYLRGIRKHMDYATGITGVKRRVSMEGFSELLNYYPPAGSKEKPRLYSRQQITRMIDKLEAAGLVVRLHRGKGVKAAMEFNLPLACHDADQQRAESEQEGASNQSPHGCQLQEVNSEQGSSNEDRATSGSPVTPNPLTTFEGSPKKSRPKKWGDPVDHDLVSEMVAAISVDLNAPIKHNPTTWANDMRLMRERDGRTVEQIRYLIEWTAKHHFWCDKVMSPSKLRDKWDQLAKQAKNEHAQKKSRLTPGRHTGLENASTEGLVAQEDGTYEF
jgi:hypothetical protein